jgi:hypothetical protein
MSTMTRAVSFAGFPRRSSRLAPRHGLRSSNRRFGRRRPFALAVPAPAPRGMSDDLRLFSATFAAGFLFVSVLIA